jgi:hypothetical protein
VRVTRPSCVLVLRCVLRVAGAPLRRATLQVQAPKDTVAEEQRADEQHGERPGAEKLRYWSHPDFLDMDMGDGISPFGRGDCSSTLSKQTLLCAG